MGKLVFQDALDLSSNVYDEHCQPLQR